MADKKIGILGGTFNPIHNGHLALAQNSLKFCDLSKVLILPSGCSYLKDQSLIMPKTDRINMVLLAIEDYPDFELSEIETNKQGNSYTCETLHDLKLMYPDDKLYFIIGADTLFNIESWKDPEEIFSLCTIIAAKRDHKKSAEIQNKISYLKEHYNARIILLDSPEVDISSSEIRSRIQKGLSLEGLLPIKVIQYIKENKLYI